MAREARGLYSSDSAVEMAAISSDAEQAAELAQAAAAGSADAQFTLGDMYQDGRGGCEQDLSRAARLFESAAEQGHVAALFALGAMHAKGQGTPQDLGGPGGRVRCGRRVLW